jgi:hypothetical protein
MSVAEAAGLVARAAVEMTGALTKKSAGAFRQQRYRERHKASLRDGEGKEAFVTNRNKSVTRDAGHEASRTVTEASQSVTSLRPDETHISFFPSVEKNLSEKKESKKERAPKKRNAPLRDDWVPSTRAYEVAEQHGVNLQIVEQIFRDYLKSSGRLYADYDAAFNNFLRNQRNFGNGKNGTIPSKSGSLVESINRELATLQQSEGTHFELPEGRILRISK